MLFKTLVFATVMPLATLAFAGAPSTEETTDAVEKWGGKAWSSSTLDSEGKIETLSLYITMPLIKGVPAGLMTMESLIVPLTDVAKEQSFFDHISLDWNSMGHEPTGIYDKPHFDIHFYNPTVKDIAALDCSEQSFIEPELVPDGYALPPDLAAVGACVPHMGVHAAPVADFAPTFDFDETFIFGYYGTKLTFFEPMITQDFFLNHKEVTETLNIPESFSLIPQAKPTTYAVTYDEAKDLYKITLGGFRVAEEPVTPID